MSQSLIIPPPAGPVALPSVHGFTDPVYATTADALAHAAGDDPIYVIYPRKIADAAKAFLSACHGETLYAVKANPNRAVLQTLWTAGVRNFDVASIREVDNVRGLLPNARLFLMHPVKSRGLIRHAYAVGVRDFAFDCASELEKILAETNGAQDLRLHLRLALPKTDAKMPLNGKFGADFDDAVTLLRTARPLVEGLGMCFHVGSQCLNTESYDVAIAYVRQIVDKAGIVIDSLDIGGGFAASYPDMPAPSFDDYFSAIKKSLAAHDFSQHMLLAEPGRALVASGGSTLARVELRKDNDTLYLNDGAYGSLFDAAHFNWRYPMTVHAKDNAVRSEETADFKLFGPTCDSIDAMAGPFSLPTDIKEGDWIEVKNLGAYGQSIAARFNGFYSETTVVVLNDE